MNRVATPAAASMAAAFVVRWQIAIVVLLSPLFLFPSLSRTAVLLLLPLVWLVAWLIDGTPLPVTPLNAALALMAVMVFVSVFATYDLAFSLPKIAGVVLGYGLFFATIRLLRDGRDLNLALHAFSIAGAALAILGLLGTNWIGKISAITSLVSRLPAVIRGIPGQSEGFQPNAVAGALVMFVPLQLALTFAEGTARRMRVVHAVALLLTAGTVGLTQSRGAWLACAAALAGWAIWHNRRARFVAISLIGVAALLAVLGRRTLESQFGVGVRADVAGRIELWDRAVTAIGDFPITGMGMNTFRRVVMVLYPTFYTSPETDVAHAHNHLLQAALDLGLPGLIAYLALWFGVAALLYQCHGGLRSGERLVSDGVAAGLLAYFLFGTADAIALGAKLGVFLWIALAIVVKMHEQAVRVP